MRFCWLVGGLSLVLASPLQAEKPYYFHKVGVDRQQYTADVLDCGELAGAVRSPRHNVIPNYSAPYGVESAAIASFLIGFLDAAERRRLISRVERTCMADKGYKRRSLDKAVSEEIRQLQGEDKLNRLFVLVASEQPTGQELLE